MSSEDKLVLSPLTSSRVVACPWQLGTVARCTWRPVVGKTSCTVDSAPCHGLALGLGMAMTKLKLILSTISQINNQEQDRIKPSYPLSQQASYQRTKNPGRLSA